MKDKSLSQQLEDHWRNADEFAIAKQCDREGWNAAIDEAIRQCEQMIASLKALLK